MRVRVLLFGMLKDKFAAGEKVLELEAGARVADVTEWARGVLGEERVVRSLAVAVNREYAGLERELCEGDEVALLPPVSGGVG